MCKSLGLRELGSCGVLEIQSAELEQRDGGCQEEGWVWAGIDEEINRKQTQLLSFWADNIPSYLRKESYLEE